MKKIIIVTFTIAFVLDLLAFSTDEAYKITSCLIERYATSGEWCDCVAECTDEELEVEFLSPESLFSCQVASNSIAAPLSTIERQNAFDQFLGDLSRTNRADVSRAYEATGSHALVFCAELGYTNGFSAATNILARMKAPCRAEAYAVVRKLSWPSLDMSEYLYGMLTNQMVYGVFDRNALFADYALRLKAVGSDTVVLTNGVSMLRRASESVRAKIPLDDLLSATCPSYAISSNRLVFARRALAMPDVTVIERQYFSAISNELLSTEGPLPNVILP